MALLAAGVGLCAGALLAFGRFGGLEAAYRYMSGQTIVVDSATRSIGIIEAGEPASVSFELRNEGWQPVRVVGCQPSCCCYVPEDFPFVLRPGERRAFRLSIANPRYEGLPKVRSINCAPVVLRTTNPAQPEIHLMLMGEIHATPRLSREGASG